jgi:predicted Zn-dependent protease
MEAASVARVDDGLERRRRASALLDATTPGRSIAVRRCKLALETFRVDGDLGEARALLRDALACSNVHHPTIYRAWISMEEQAASGGDGDAGGIRKLFEAWSRWYQDRNKDAGAGGSQQQDEGGFWCHYIDFELRRGSAASARGVAERAVAACPGDPAVHAKYAKAELRLGCPDRARAVLLSALDAFAADAGAREWLEREVAEYGDSMRHGSWRRLRGLLLPFCRRCRRWSRPAQGYHLLAAA